MLELRCAACGMVGVEPALVDVLLNTRDDFAVYVFTCPRCLEVSDGGDRRRVAELLAAGAPRLELRSAAAPPLTCDDLLELHALLEADVAWSVPDVWTAPGRDHGPSGTGPADTPDTPLHPG